MITSMTPAHTEPVWLPDSDPEGALPNVPGDWAPARKVEGAHEALLATLPEGLGIPLALAATIGAIPLFEACEGTPPSALREWMATMGMGRVVAPGALRAWAESLVGHAADPALPPRRPEHVILARGWIPAAQHPSLLTVWPHMAIVDPSPTDDVPKGNYSVIAHDSTVLFIAPLVVLH